MTQCAVYKYVQDYVDSYRSYVGSRETSATIRDSESIHGNVKSYFLFSMVVMACKEINSQRERETDWEGEKERERDFFYVIATLSILFNVGDNVFIVYVNTIVQTRKSQWILEDHIATL